jgi:hypothetical protein
MMSIFYVSLVFLVLYIAPMFAVKPGRPLTMPLRYFTGLSYFVFCVLFTIFMHLRWGSIWITVLTIISLVIFMYVTQFIIGSVLYYLRRS